MKALLIAVAIWAAYLAYTIIDEWDDASADSGHWERLNGCPVWRYD